MILNKAKRELSEVLETILKFKHIEYKTVDNMKDPILSDRELEIDDPFIAIKYLNDRYPKPDIFDSDPSQMARLNLFAIDAIKYYKRGNADVMVSQLESVPLTDDFLAGNRLTVADILILPAIPDTKHWLDYKQRVQKELDK